MFKCPPSVAGVLVSAILSIVGAGASPAGAAESGHPGKPLYLRYCGACHGPEAKGDGIVATFMRPKPADLTLIASRHGGEFPLEQVVTTIDGREMLRAHGAPAMPVWGEVLSRELGSTKKRVPIERRVQGRILFIAEYLKRIQVK